MTKRCFLTLNPHEPMIVDNGDTHLLTARGGARLVLCFLTVVDQSVHFSNFSEHVLYAFHDLLHLATSLGFFSVYLEPGM